MKKLLIILSIAILATSCKKEKLYNCLEGEWNGQIGQIGDGFTIHNGSATYLIGTNKYATISFDKNGNMIFNGDKIGTADCNGNTLTITYTNMTPIVCTKVN